MEIGQIVGTHGLNGEVRVNPWCDTPDFLQQFGTLYYDAAGRQAVTVNSVRPHGNIALLCLEGIITVAQAQALRDKVLYMRRADAKLADGVYFIAEVLGSTVRDADEDGHIYGEICDVSKTGANDVWHVRAQNGRVYLLPVIPDVVVETNIPDGYVRIRPLKGIFDAD